MAVVLPYWLPPLLAEQIDAVDLPLSPLHVVAAQLKAR